MEISTRRRWRVSCEATSGRLTPRRNRVIPSRREEVAATFDNDEPRATRGNCGDRPSPALGPKWSGVRSELATRRAVTGLATDARTLVVREEGCGAGQAVRRIHSNARVATVGRKGPVPTRVSVRESYRRYLTVGSVPSRGTPGGRTPRTPVRRASPASPTRPPLSRRRPYSPDPDAAMTPSSIGVRVKGRPGAVVEQSRHRD